MTKKTSNIVSLRKRTKFATAADTLDIEALMRELDGQGANSVSYRQSSLSAGDIAPLSGGRRRIAA